VPREVGDKNMEISQEWNFGDDKELADRLKELVLSGKKKATTSLYSKNKKIPQVGDYEAILDSDKKRFCIIRCTNVEAKPFLEVRYDFIQKEGEGDKDVEEWREKHRRFFNLKGDNVKVVCEEFEVILQYEKEI
jgi:uncharacterized protein YhfF